MIMEIKYFKHSNMNREPLTTMYLRLFKNFLCSKEIVYKELSISILIKASRNNLEVCTGPSLARCPYPARQNEGKHSNGPRRQNTDNFFNGPGRTGPIKNKRAGSARRKNSTGQSGR